MSFESSDTPNFPPLEGVRLQPVEPLPPLQPLQPVEPLAPSEQLDESAAVGGPPPLLPVEPLLADQLQPLQPTMPPAFPEPPSLDDPPSPPLGPAPASEEEIANLGVPLGTLIFRAGLLTEEQLEEALQEGVRTGKRLGEVLVEGGLLDERDLGRLLAGQKGLPFVELGSMHIHPTAVSMLPVEKARMHLALPVGYEAGVPLVAVADPSNELVVENLSRTLGGELRLVVASRSDLLAAIDRVHQPVGAVPAEPEPVPAPSFEPPPPAPFAEPAAQEPVLETYSPPQVSEVSFPPAPTPVTEPQSPVAEEPTFSQAVFPSPPPATPEPSLEPALPEQNGHSWLPPVPEQVAQPVSPLVPEPVQQLAPVEPAPVEPAPVEPAPVEPAPVEPAPVQLAPVELPTVEPVPVEPAPVEPFPVEPAAAELTFSRVAAESEPQPDSRDEGELPTALSYEVSLRLSDGERVPVGSFGEPQKAREYARDVVRHLSEEGEGWPFFNGRFMRPDTIVSVDIVPVGEPDRWLGSTVRANWASRLNRS